MENITAIFDRINLFALIHLSYQWQNSGGMSRLSYLPYAAYQTVLITHIIFYSLHVQFAFETVNILQFTHASIIQNLPTITNSVTQTMSFTFKYSRSAYQLFC